MSRGRKAHVDPPVNVMTSIPMSLNAKIELLLYDPVLQKPKYGGRSALIQQLLREWVEKQQSLVKEKPAEGLTQPPPNAMLNSQSESNPLKGAS